MAPNMSLFSVNAILILSADDGSRILAKYYNAPHPPQGTPAHSTNYPGANPYPNVKDQKAFEKGLFEKTAKQTSDITLYDNRIVVFKMESDIMMYVVGGAEENEIMLYNVILALRDSLSILLKNSTDRRTLTENYDLAVLAVDELVDDGIILETDPVIVASRVSRPPAQDIQSVIAHELSNTLTSLRVTNIYDLSSHLQRIFLFKFHKPDHRAQFIVDSGFRCHLTSFSRATAAAPSAFVSRLRKHLKSRRITSVAQIGTDRIIEFQFSDGLYRLFLEFYAGGNIVLTDAELNVIALLRVVSEGAEHEQLRVGLKYDLELRQNYHGVPELTKERARDGLQKAVERQQESTAAGKKIKKKGGDELRKALAVSITEFPPMLLDHALRSQGYDVGVKPEDVLKSEELLDKLMVVLQEADKTIKEITSAEYLKIRRVRLEKKASLSLRA
ncbi:hypothetical protein LTS18_008038 [Coniosporium uncinatum]|uniref:Uncharacterized protein n=1 Tax=Coniosporium uncinatum TaxID=93489 RepID=A0ACC3D222_9PEZI|nr:hypothetical protein LTS18_008038 [Coniosporium uncinatum]